MRKAKIATTIFFVLGIALVLAMPWIIRAKPPSAAAAADRRVFALWFTIYSMTLLVVFFGAVVSAWMMVRKQREQFREASMSNLKELIEGTLSDHGRKQDS